MNGGGEVEEEETDSFWFGKEGSSDIDDFFMGVFEEGLEMKKKKVQFLSSLSSKESLPFFFLFFGSVETISSSRIPFFHYGISLAVEKHGERGTKLVLKYSIFLDLRNKKSFTISHTSMG